MFVFYRERMETGQIPPIKQFSRMFVAIPQGEGLSIVNDTLYVTHATREQSEVIYCFITVKMPFRDMLVG